jgi:hypothetical protein
VEGAQLRLGEVGCSSTWLTAGSTPVCSAMCSMCSAVKFETPIDRALPAARMSTSARHESA